MNKTLFAGSAVSSMEIEKMNRTAGLLRVLRAIALVVAVAVLATTRAEAELPSVRVLQAALVDPTTADSWYALQTASGTHVCALIPANEFCSSGRPAKIKALARTLGADRYDADSYAQHVLEYIYSAIDTEFRYGLSKGAYGTLLDQSGTPFDQAMLMVELLREGRVPNTGYVAGTITLSGTQFADWTGVTDAVAACRLLADGGIPAIINGSTSSNCTYAGTVTAVTLSHIWVSANGKLYDPSYKKYNFKAGIDLAEATGCSGSTCATAVQNAAIPTGSLYQGTDTGAYYVQNVQTSALAGLMADNGNSYGRSLENKIRSDFLTSSVDDIAGGRRIDVSTVPTAGAVLPYQVSVQRSWSADIPDQYRSRLGIHFDDLNIWLFADEIDGYWLTLTGALDNSQSYSTTRYSELHLTIPQTPNFADSWYGGPFRSVALIGSNKVADPTTAALTVSIDHPYYAANDTGGALGTYMDESNVGSVGLIISGGGTNTFRPMRIVSFWGATGPGRLTETHHQVAVQFENPNLPKQCLTFTTPILYCYETNPSEVSFINTFAAQATAGLHLVDGVNKARTEMHHHVGISSSAFGVTLVDSRSALSMVSMANVGADRTSAIRSGTAVLSALEGSVGQQLGDSWEGYSAIGRFGLANEKSVRFLEVNSTNMSDILGTVISAISCSGGILSNYDCIEKLRIKQYLESTNPAFGVIVPKNRDIGPFAYPGLSTLTINDAPLFAFSSDESRSAYVTTSGLKGSGTSSLTLQTALQSTALTDPKRKLEEAYKVDLTSGKLSISPASPLVTGQGKFPYALPLDIYFDSDAGDPTPVDWGSDPNIPGLNVPYPRWRRDLDGGWRHRYEIEANATGDGLQALGADSALDASGAVAALQVMRTISTQVTPTLNSRLSLVFVAQWLMDHFAGNSVVVSRPPASSTFVRLPSGIFNPPPGSVEQLVQTGTRNRRLMGAYNYDYQNVQYTYTASDGGTILFSSRDNTFYSGSQFYQPKFVATHWEFPNGLALDFQYDLRPFEQQPLGAYYRVSGVSNSLGRSLTFNVDESGAPGYGHKIVVTGDSGASATLSSNNTGALRIEDSAQRATQFEALSLWNAPSATQAGLDLVPPSPLRLTTVYAPTDPVTPYATFAYDEAARIKTVTHKDGRVTTYYPARVSAESFSRGEIVGEIVDGVRPVSTTYFDEGGRPVQSIDPIGRRTSSAYDGAGRLKKTIRAEGDSTEYNYDSRHNVTSVTRWSKDGTASLVSSSIFPPTCQNAKSCNQPTSVTDARDNTTAYTYNDYGQTETITKPAVLVGLPETLVQPFTRFFYTSPADTGGISMLDRQVDKIDAITSVTMKFEYDTAANHRALKKVTSDLGGLNLQTQIFYDGIGNITSVTDPRGKVTSYCNDAARQLTRVTRQIGTLDYADCNTLPPASGDDVVTVQVFDADGRLEQVRRKEAEAGAWRDTTFHYMPGGVFDTVKDPEGNVTQYEYDRLGRVALVTNGAGQKTRTFYFRDGRVRKILKGYAFAATSTNESCYVANTDQFCYAQYAYAPAGTSPENYNGNVYSQTDGNGNVTTMSYDPFDRLARTTFPDASWEAVSLYDENDNVRYFRNRAGEVIEHTYDALNRPDTRSNATFPSVSFRYDLLGHLKSANQAGGQALSWTYDNVGRVKSETAGTRTLGYDYDEAGNRTRLTWPDNVYVDYTYDDADRMDLVKDEDGTILADYSYDTLSRRRTLLLANGHTTSFAYEPDDDLSSITYSGLDGTPSLSFLHNAAHQITDLTANIGSMMAAPTAASVSYVPNALNQYGSVNGVTYAYDARGNLTSDGSATYTYDAENRLKQAATASGTATYSYDGLGRRYAKSVDGAVTEFLSDGEEEVAEYGAGGALLRRYVYGPGVDDRVLMYETAGVAATDRRFYYTNHQGSTLYVADGSGAVVESFGYGPYGESSVPLGNPFQYTGRRYDPETGLYYYRARYYSPSLGRFLQADPIGSRDDVNLYAYTGNDSVNKRDPSGLASPEAGCASTTGDASKCGSSAERETKQSGTPQKTRGPNGQQHADASVGQARETVAAAQGRGEMVDSVVYNRSATNATGGVLNSNLRADCVVCTTSPDGTTNIYINEVTSPSQTDPDEIAKWNDVKASAPEGVRVSVVAESAGSILGRLGGRVLSGAPIIGTIDPIIEETTTDRKLTMMEFFYKSIGMYDVAVARGWVPPPPL